MGHENLFGDFVFERLAVGEAHEVGDCVIRHAVNFIVQRSGDMRSKMNVRKRIKLRPVLRGFGTGDVEQSGEIRTVLHNLAETRFINLRAASGVDERCSFAHGGEHLLRENMFVVLAVRKVVADHIRRAERLFQ